ncbi:FAD-dependent oxidoreductase [Butyrivibrio sp. INlla16]|uniref:FAD-dependent oxidoreductase n=1 Tax=Butyrivibrio sp. INlla16 TaxID=1520807 RepID=UPI00088CF601|nr:FAD-dependent oxidoreductase [Butyrivibrio sp. INlla16]SDB66777.1 NAD(P)-binding Rossmann-like domain-containing protein [Butyrivibrio sp. INlla16]
MGMQKKVVIIGGGIAGLSAGIYARLAGFEAEIYEKNSTPGGECTGWNREGFHIDNCIHWLTGTKKGTELYGVYKGHKESLLCRSVEQFTGRTPDSCDKRQVCYSENL